MNCLKIDPNLLKIDTKIREYNYIFLDILKEYKLPIEIYYDYLLSIEEFKLKSLWNHTIKKWNQMKQDLSDKQDFIKSELSTTDYHQIHKKMTDTELNKVFSDLIGLNYYKGIFVCNCIQNYIYPK
ncbi:MAG TPA: hypothetical protein HPP54_10825 [Nitrospinae bacterium]|nr:hypothetical protein [Nitrospinota bacterium]